MNKKGLRNIARIKPFTLFLLGLVVSCGAFFAQPTVTHAEEDITAIAKKNGDNPESGWHSQSSHRC